MSQAHLDLHSCLSTTKWHEGTEDAQASKANVFWQSKQRWSYCGNRVALCSSGTAAIMSTSFGALAKQYLREACSHGQHGAGWPSCTVPSCAQLKGLYLTLHIVQVYIPAVFDSGNQFTNNFSNGLDTCLQFGKRGLDRVQEHAADMLPCTGTSGTAA